MIEELLVNPFMMSVQMIKAGILMFKLMPQEMMMGLGMFCGLFLMKPMMKVLDKLNDAPQEDKE